MFSNRSVSVHPSAPPIEKAGCPRAGVLAARRNAGHVAGGLMPAALKAAVEYQTVDLLAPLKKRP